MSMIQKSTTKWVAALVVALAGGGAAGGGAAVIATAAPPSAADAQAAEASFLKEAIAQTPYSALVVYTRVDIKPVTGKNGKANLTIPPADDVVTEERHTYHARVIETFRGKAVPQVRYDMVVVRGESANVDTTPKILTLCSGPQGFYWPGTGAVFTASKDAVVLARQTGKEAASSATRMSKPFAQCD
jgi:hypothetical protein